MKIFVGGLPSDVSEDDLRAAFERFGAVESVALIRERVTGELRGFAFVEMADPDDAGSAIAGLNGKVLRGRALRVNEARPRSDDPRREVRS